MSAAFLPQLQVLAHRELGENLAVFWHIADAQVRNFVGLFTLNGLAFPVNTTLAFHQTHDGFGRGGAARAVAPEQGHNFTLPDFEINAMKHMAFAVIGMKVIDLQHQWPPTWLSATGEPR